jgi:DNA ligase-1
MECIRQIATSKNLSIEQFINETQEHGYSKVEYPLGIHGRAVYPDDTTVVKRKEDLYVPALEVMTGFNYAEHEIKSGRDAVIKRQYNVPDAPIGWWVSEKYDGQRAIWDGEKFVSRGASAEPRVYPYVPRWFMACMPPGIALDGELFLERNSFSETTSILKTRLKPERQRKKGDPSQQDLDRRWAAIQYRVFDVITGDLYEQRKQILKEIVKQRTTAWKSIPVPFYIKKGPCPLVFTEQYQIKSQQELMKFYNSLVDHGAEGVMIRAPGIPYIPRRTKLMLKMKLVDDAECKIIGYKPGEGKYQGLLGSFECTNGVSKFFVSGMNDTIRKNYRTTHPVGTLLTYTFNGLTSDSIPRHPRYKGIRGD